MRHLYFGLSIALVFSTAADAQQPFDLPRRSVEVVQNGESGSQPVQEAGTGPPWEIAAWSATDVSDLRWYDEQVDARVRPDELVLVSRQLDRDVPGRVHEGFAQYHEGVRVHGGNISRQLASGVTVSIFGKLHEGIDVDVETTPRLSMDEALDRVERESGIEPVASSRPELVVLPDLLNTYALAWRVQARDLRTYFVGAHTGNIVHDESAVHEQAAVGIGRGIQGQPKKLSTSQAGGEFQAYDRLRPAEIVTLDLDHREHRWESLMDADGPKWRPSDVASDPDNDWRDAAVVDVHAYAGFTFDWFARQGWHGMDGRNGRVMSMVNLSPLAREMNDASGAIRTRAWIGARRATIDQVMEINRALAPVSGHEPDLTLLTEKEGSPVYMRRWWLQRQETENERGQNGLYVHVFENDDPEGFHNHPWPSASLLLNGGPVFEHTPHGTTIIENRSIVLRPLAHRHRIRLRQGPTPNDGSVARIPAMTLFATGRRVQQWGFEQPDGSIRPAKATAPADQPQPRN